MHGLAYARVFENVKMSGTTSRHDTGSVHLVNSVTCAVQLELSLCGPYVEHY